MRSRGPSSIEGRRSMSLCVSESWDLIQRHERSVMVTGIVGSASVLLDDDPFRTPRLAANFGIHIVLAIVTARQKSFPILKRPAADISREGFALMLLNRLQQVFGFLQGVLRDAMQLSIEGRRGVVKR